MLSSYCFIDTNSALADFCASVVSDDYIAVDTEFERRTTYYPILSLVQIATASQVAIIDAQSVDISLLQGIFVNAKITKVFHASRQDVEILEYIFAQPINNIFDTQIGVVLIGFEENLSFFNLINHFLGIEIDKSQQNKSWLNRPLTERQLQYAYKDVAYLFKVFLEIRRQLVEQGRMAWLQEIQKKMLSHSSFNFLDYWQKVKVQSSNLKVWFRLRRLWLWREMVAEKQNMHRLLIFSDKALLLLAQYKELPDEKLQQKLPNFYKVLSGLNVWEDFITLYKQSFLDLEETNKTEIQNEFQIIQKHLASRKPVSFSSEIINKVKHLNQFILELSRELKIPKHYLASAEEIQMFAASPAINNPLLQGWRGEFFQKFEETHTHNELG